MSFAFAELVRRIERRIVAELELVPRPLPADLARLDGTFRGEPARLVARAYSGPRLGYFRCVEIASRDLDIGNVLALPRVDFALPLLGIDLVEVGRDTAVVVADLSPMTALAAERERELAVLARHRPLEPLGAAAALPAWAAEWFSNAPLSVRVSPAQARASEAAVEAYATAFIELVRASVADGAHADPVAGRQRAYSAAHRERDRGLLLLRRIFDPVAADRLLREVLFPEVLPR